MPKLKFKIVTPERLLIEEEIDQVTLPTSEGQITVMKDHLPLVSTLAPGELVMKTGSKETPLAVSGGFIEVRDNTVTVLADTAERIEELDLARAEEARKKAETLLKTRTIEHDDYALMQARLEKELARLRVGRKHKRSHFGEQKLPSNS